MQLILEGFSTEVASELGINFNDLLILRWFVDLQESKNAYSIEIDGKVYYKVDYKAVCEDYPILYMKPDTIYRHFKKMCDKDILNKKTVFIEKNSSFYTLGKNYNKLI